MSVTINGSTGVSGVDGSATTPAFQGSDTNTGLFYGTDIVGISTGGSERVRVDASGNVGIGTTSPTGKLDVRVTGDGSRIANLFNTTQALGFRIRTSGTDNFIEAVNTAEDAYTGCKIIAGPLSLESATFTKFNTNGAERMRIDSSGRLMLGTTTTSISSIDAKYFDAADGQRLFSSRGSTAAREHIIFLNPNGDVGSIDTTGSSTAYNTNSDYRLKENIVPMTGALDKVSQLKPVTYKWKIDGSDGQGFIAHELAEVVPDCVSGEKDAVDAEGNPKYQGIDASFLVATLTAAIQEQQELIKQLQLDVSALKEANNV